MSNWMSKDLTLDLLAIGIHSLNKIHQRISQEPGEWPSETPPATEVLPSAEPELKPALAPGSEEPAAQEDDGQALRAEAQTLLRTINQTHGKDGITWITGTLFPHFGVTSLTEVPADKLPELITMAKTYTDERSAA
ncbi:hypothetical protein QP968_00585 [Corynebacterium sp. MSK041]|uniref:hypothetical protein n=1 Tax=Corynebacterium sp. MSK041 TaxID=3050194 RepID=UPI0025513718|nr:hypothetical protein [Corynebacterium sp. MSK041]MDK8794209.1 hypothetical protein [Corynebacterium sp. MSK041]